MFVFCCMASMPKPSLDTHYHCFVSNQPAGTSLLCKSDPGPRWSQTAMFIASFRLIMLLALSTLLLYRLSKIAQGGLENICLYHIRLCLVGQAKGQLGQQPNKMAQGAIPRHLHSRNSQFCPAPHEKAFPVSWPTWNWKTGKGFDIFAEIWQERLWISKGSEIWRIWPLTFPTQPAYGNLCSLQPAEPLLSSLWLDAEAHNLGRHSDA